MCPNHHNLIDDLEPEMYSVDFLLELKERMLTDRWRPSDARLEMIADQVLRLWVATTGDGAPTSPRPDRMASDGKPSTSYDWVFQQVRTWLKENPDDWAPRWENPHEWARRIHVDEPLALDILPLILESVGVYAEGDLADQKLGDIITRLSDAGAIIDPDGQGTDW